MMGEGLNFIAAGVNRFINANKLNWNPQKKTPWISEYNGVIYQGHSTARVMLPTHEERMEKLAQAVAKWRQTLKKQNYNPVYNY